MDVDIILPSYDLEACGRYETKFDQDVNNESFTQAIEKLFGLLKPWENDTSPRNLSLNINKVISHSDLGGAYSKSTLERTFRRIERRDVLDNRYKWSLIRLLRVDTLPFLKNVTSINMCYGGRNFGSPNLVDISLKLPSLESFDWFICDTNTLEDPPASGRARFASAPSKCVFPSLKEANLDFEYEAPSNQNSKPENLVGNHEYDPVGAAMFKAFSHSTSLTTLKLKGTFDSALFWPHNDQILTESNPIWPRLEKLEIKLDLVSPSGHWYFIDVSGEDPEVVHRVQTQPEGPDDDEWDSEDSEDSRGNPRYPISRDKSKRSLSFCA